MKKILTILFLLSLGTSYVAFSQFQVNMSNTGNQLMFKLKPTVNTNATFSVMEFFVRYPAASPAFTYGEIIENSTNFPGIGNFTVQAEPTVGGYRYDHFIYTAPDPVTTAKDYIMGQEYTVFTVLLQGSGSVDFELVHREDFDPFYLALTNGLGADISTLNPATYFYPATTITGVTPTRVFLQSLSDVVLPVNFLSFYALNSGEAAVLSWTVSNDEDNQYFDIERSADGRSYTAFARVNAKANGLNTNSYEVTDPAFSKQGSREVFYRIRQVDRSGSVKYSMIRTLTTARDFGLSLFPNPVRTVTKLVIDVPTESKGSIIVRDMNGKQVQLINTLFVKGINQKDINVSMLPAGDYNLTVVGTNLNQTIKFAKQ